MEVNYDRLDKMVIDIYIDYNLCSFPIDIFDLARRMGIELINYSSVDEEGRQLFLKRSTNGFYCKVNGIPNIFYNDLICNKEQIRMTIAHEIKHYVDQDVEEDNELSEGEAKHFARYLLCPTPYLIYKKIDNIEEIMSIFDLSYSAATYALSSEESRLRAFGRQIFAYEKPLINLLESKTNKSLVKVGVDGYYLRL